MTGSYTKQQRLARGPKKSGRVKASADRWEEIRARKLGPCRVCGYGSRKTFEAYAGPITLHHMVSKSLGGADTESNLVPLCGTGTTGCHGLIEAHDRPACRTLAASLTDAEYAYAVTKLGEDGFLRRYVKELA